ncbi:MAG: ribosome small subunit-dependent GTPase A [Nitriliruptorales bacterium]
MGRIDIEALEEEWDEDEQAPRPRSRTPQPGEPDAPVGRVVGLHKGWVEVVVDGEEHSAVYGGAMRGEQVVVGDRALVRLPRHETDTARIVARLDRETVLLRTADDTVAEERVVVANADLVVVVVAADELDRGARFADRVLVAAEAGGLEGALCVNKVDVVGASDGLEGALCVNKVDVVGASGRARDTDRDTTTVEARYEAAGYRVVETSAKTGDGMDDLRGLLEDRWTVLSGHSGVGKSSLFNRLVPGAGRRVAELGRFGGRHTTVSALAMAIPGVDEGWLVDTPGVRSFGIAHVAPEDLAQCFPELRGVDCELPGCLHDGEPGCAVPGLVGERIPPERHESYLRFLRVLRGVEPDTGADDPGPAGTE